MLFLQHPRFKVIPAITFLQAETERKLPLSTKSFLEHPLDNCDYPPGSPHETSQCKTIFTNKSRTEEAFE